MRLGHRYRRIIVDKKGAARRETDLVYIFGLTVRIVCAALALTMIIWSIYSAIRR